jgi:small-conductance mechanosensitive channel
MLWPLRRAIGGDTGLVLSALTTFLKTGIWMIALALALSVLGFDVTAIVAGLGIGGLAIGLAAQPMIADMIAALVIFAEGKFKIGEVIKLGNSEPAKVVGLAWRSTQLRNTLGLVAHIPNRQVTEQTVQNLTKAGRIFDVLDVTVTTQREVSNVLAVIKKALEECRYLTADHGVSVREFTQKGETKVVKYRFWWFVEEYEGRDKTRDEVFNRISRSLDEEDLRETEVSLA